MLTTSSSRDDSASSTVPQTSNGGGEGHLHHQQHQQQQQKKTSSSTGAREEEEAEVDEEEEEAIAVPAASWQDGQQPIKPQPMEPIPEDEEESGVSPSTSFFMVQSNSVGGALVDSASPSRANGGTPLIAVTTPSSNGSPVEETAINGDTGSSPAAIKSPNNSVHAVPGEGRRVTECRQRLRETYTTEEVDTLVSTLPKEAVPLEWENFSSAEEVVVDPKMAHTYVTELAGGLPSARGSKYSYTYESRLENGEGNGDEMGDHGLDETPTATTSPVERREVESRTEREERLLGSSREELEEGMERHSTSTQKITRVTKITTTRSVKQIPVGPGDIYFDADGNPILNGFDAETVVLSPSPGTQHGPGSSEEENGEFAASRASMAVDPGVGIDLSRTFLSEHEEQQRQFYGTGPGTSRQQMMSPQSLAETSTSGQSGGRGRQQQEIAYTPSAPGMPQITELTPSTISLAWLRPDFDGTAGPLIGYRVEFRRSDYDEWDPAHDDLLGETECKTNHNSYTMYHFPPSPSPAGHGHDSASTATTTTMRRWTSCAQMMRFEAFESMELLLSSSSFGANGNEEFGFGGHTNGFQQFSQSSQQMWRRKETPMEDSAADLFTNLDPDEPYQFRVLGANIAGFGQPSAACPPIRLREQTQFGTEALAPPPPGRPQVIGTDGNRATIEWRPSLADPSVTTINGGGGGVESPLASKMAPAVIGYLVEYREAGSPHWIAANDRPVPQHRLQVLNLRPNGEFEFRVLAQDEFGRQSASPSSGFVRIRPPAPIRHANGGVGTGYAPMDLASVPEPAGQPKVLETGPNWVHLHWAPRAGTSSSASPASSSPPAAGQSPSLAFLVEMRELGEHMWTPLADQHISPAHGLANGTADGQQQQLHRVPVTTTMDHFIVENLLPDSAGYEFRVWSICLLSGLRSAQPSVATEPIRLRPLPPAGSAEWSPPSGAISKSRKLPERPQAPEYLDYDGGTSLTLCWLPARSVLPVQGYEVEFRDLMQDATHWYKMTDQLVRACKTSVGYLLQGHQYQFRVLAKNAVGLSQPSDPSPLVSIGVEPAKSVVLQQQQQQQHQMTPLLDDNEDMMGVRESPPLPDRDDSPPPIYRQTESSLQWRDPTLKEVIDYLKSPDQSLVLDASGYLQHLTYNNDTIKEETRNYGGIECLISLLRSADPELLRNVCGCLKNLAFGKANDANKRLIHQKGGLKALAQLLRNSQQTAGGPLVLEEATGALWNISSADDLKEAVLTQTAETVVQHAVLPFSGLPMSSQQSAGGPMASTSAAVQGNHVGGGRNPAANVFRNGTGILRNISAVNDQARRFLRSAPGLVDALLHFLEGALQRGQLDTRSTENVVCLLRNLSYRVQEVVDPKFDPNRSRYQMREMPPSSSSTAAAAAENGTNGNLPPPSSGRSTERSKSAPSGSPKAASNLQKTKSPRGGGLFRRGKKSAERRRDSSGSRAPAGENALLAMPAPTGPQRLWHPSTVRLYIRVLQDSADCEILEASAAALQNLAGCPFDGSTLVRQTVRTEKGLPILVELLRLREDRVVCAVCCALRNLALDQTNLELVGKYALPELLVKIPDGPTLEMLRQQPSLAAEQPSDATLGAILGILWEAVRHSAELTRGVHQTAEGTERLRALAKAYPIYGRRVCKYATQVLYMMWQHKELHEQFRRSGLAEADFYSGTLHVRGGKKGGGDQQLQLGGGGDKPSPSSVATTLARPFSSQGMERPAHLALPSSRMDESAADSSHYGAFSTPPQSVRVSPPQSANSSGGPVAKPPRQHHHLKNGQRQHFEPTPVDHLYASVQKSQQQQQQMAVTSNGHQEHAGMASSGNGGGGGRRPSIDSWV